MANKPKMTAEWFPHYAAQKKTVPVLKALFGSDGYSFWYQLLEMLAASEGHFIDCSIAGEFEFICTQMAIPVERAVPIFEKLLERGKVDRELWEADRIIWCQGLVNNLDRLYNKRENKPQRPKPAHKFDSRPGNANSRPGLSYPQAPQLFPREDQPDQPEAHPQGKPERKSDSRAGNGHSRSGNANSDPEKTRSIGQYSIGQKGNTARQTTAISEAAAIYREIFHFQLNHVQRDELVDLIKTPEDLELWRDILKTWALNGWNPKAIGKMVNAFNQGGVQLLDRNDSLNVTQRSLLEVRKQRERDNHGIHGDDRESDPAALVMLSGPEDEHPGDQDIPGELVRPSGSGTDEGDEGVFEDEQIFPDDRGDQGES